MRAALEGAPELARLEQLRDAIATTFPELPFDEELLARALGKRVDGPAALAAIHGADVYLAELSGRGDAKAVRVFEALVSVDLNRAIAKSPTLGITADEFRQLALERLLVGQPPRIASFRGQGTLRSWVRVMASRLIVDLARRKDKATDTNDELAKRIGVSDDAEIEVLRRAYGAFLPQAFERAVGRLTVRQRNLLRQRYLHEITVERLATIYAVHRSTLFDWLDKARSVLFDHVRDELAVAIPGEKLDSIVQLLGSKMHVSVRRMLDSRLESEDVNG